MSKTIESILVDLLELQSDLENRINQIENTGNVEALEKLVLELMKVKNAIVHLKPSV